MFDDALKSDEEETEDLNSASDKNESNTTRKSRRLLFKRNNKDKQTTDLNSKVSFQLALHKLSHLKIVLEK